MLLFIFITVFSLWTQAHAGPLPKTEDAGDMLFLSPYIKNGSIELAKRLSKVEPINLFLNVSSYSGFITVDEQYDSNLWFWYFPAVEKKPDEEAPFLIWLQGGPGLTSTYGLFQEIGPFSYDDKSSTLIENPHSWNKHHNLLFIDNPVGTGYSFTNESSGYTTNQTTISKHLYNFLIQFLKVYPELQKAPLYIAGESYGGRHVPSFAHEIHLNNLREDVEMKINLTGIAIGNGFIDPSVFYGYSEFLYQLGFIDDRFRAKVAKREKKCKKYLEDGNFTSSNSMSSCRTDLFFYIWNELELNEFNVYNFAQELTDDHVVYPYLEFLIKDETRKALHVGKANFDLQGWDVYLHLIKDAVTGSSKAELEELLDNYKVLLYSGQLDIMCPYPMSVKLYRNLSWSHSEEYLNADREAWKIDKIVAGYFKKAGNLLEVLVRNAGHSVPADQPARALLLIESFINDKELNVEPRRIPYFPKGKNDSAENE